MPEGVSYEGVFGQRQRTTRSARTRQCAALAYKSISADGVGGVSRHRTLPPPTPPSPRQEKARSERRKRRRQARRRSRCNAPPDAIAARASAQARSGAAVGLQRHQQGNLQLTAQESRFVQNGKVAVEVWLADATPEVLLQLKQLGFEQLEEPKVAKILTGPHRYRQAHGTRAAQRSSLRQPADALAGRRAGRDKAAVRPTPRRDNHRNGARQCVSQPCPAFFASPHQPAHRPQSLSQPQSSKPAAQKLGPPPVA